MTDVDVPVLPRASEVRDVVQAVESGLKFLRGLATAIERVEKRPTDATIEQTPENLQPRETE